MILKPRKNRKGFTLIELIVVVAIIAILAAIAVPSFIGLNARAQEGVDIANATALAGAINTYNALYPDAKLASADATLLGNAQLYPAGIDPARLSKATDRLKFGTVVTVNTSNPFKP